MVLFTDIEDWFTDDSYKNFNISVLFDSKKTMEDSEHIRLNEDKWNKWAPVADGNGRLYEYLRKAQNHVLELAGLKEGINFLDIGCGTGWAVGQAAKMVQFKGMFYGIDISAKMIEKAQENYNNREIFHFVKANSESIPLEDNVFDIIICTNSFHHYLHPDKVMKEIYRLLNSGGKIYILDPIADNLFIKIIDKIIKLTEKEHVKIYSSKEFKNLMKTAGLKYLGYDTSKKHRKVQIGIKE
jgi:ubiquinone/menaquinone biosynthesis C-methylase UbiE